MSPKFFQFLLLIFIYFKNFIYTSFTILNLNLLEEEDQSNSIYLDYLLSNEIKFKKLYVISIIGKQSVMKSTLLRSLGKYLKLQDSNFESCHSMYACTKSISIAGPSSTNIVLIDTPGIDTENLENQMVQLIQPVLNILIYAIHRRITPLDLHVLAMYCDPNITLSSENHQKPTLIIAIRAKRIQCVNNGKLSDCTADEYLTQQIPETHATRANFSSFHGVHIPDLIGTELISIHNKTFEPEQVDRYWESIKSMSNLILEIQRSNTLQLRTGEEIATILQQSFSSINTDQHNSIILINVENAAKEVCDIFFNSSYPFHVDPFNPLHTLEEITTTKNKYEKSLFDQFAIHSENKELWKLIEASIRTSIDETYNEILLNIENKKRKIINEINNLYESSSLQISNSSSKILNTIVGDPEIINGEFTNELTAVLNEFYKKAKDTKGDTSSIDILYNRLKESSITSINLAHAANEIKHINRKLELQKKGLPPIEFSIHERHSHCGNGGVDHHFNLLDRAPNYFSDNVLPFILSIDLKFHGSHGGNGRLILQGNNQEYSVHQTSTGGKKGHSSGTFYNPVTKNLRVHLEGWGWGGGNCNNRKEMSSLQFTITPNGLYDSPPHYSQDYKKGTNTLID